MNEKDLNIEYICKKTLLNKDDELVPIILDLIQDSYKAGLCQAEFDNTMNLIEEIQELKKHLKVPKACNLKTLEDYKSYYEDTTREKKLEDTYIEYCAYVNLAHRYSKLEKQLEQYQEEVCILDMRTDENIKLINQQKEFIKYLEDEIKQINPKILDDGELNLRLDDIKYTQYLTYKEILQKYKEIIGGNK